MQNKKKLQTRKVLFSLVALILILTAAFIASIFIGDWRKTGCYKQVDSKLSEEEASELVYDLSDQEKSDLGIGELVPLRRFYEMRKCLKGIK